MCLPALLFFRIFSTLYMLQNYRIAPVKFENIKIFSEYLLYDPGEKNLKSAPSHVHM